jgi:hypothetical protein
MTSLSEDETYARKEAMWIARWAIRAVTKEIIRTGKINLPLTVRFESGISPDWWRSSNGRN